MRGFQSILYDEDISPQSINETRQPEFFSDLNLDQLVDTVTAGREEYNLKPYFYVPLHSVATLEYRQEVMKDVESGAIFAHLTSFADNMRSVRELLAQGKKLYYPRQQHRWFMEAVDSYCVAVGCLARDLTLAEPHSRGLQEFRDYLTQYSRSEAFTAVLDEIAKLRSSLSAVRYRLQIADGSLEVSRYEPEPDYGGQVSQTFEKFKQGATREYTFEFSDWAQMNHVEAAVLDRVALLYPDVFRSLEKFRADHSAFLDSTIQIFDREVQFYLSILEHARKLKSAGLPLCYPTVDDHTKEIDCEEIYDLALASKLAGAASRLVRNDARLRGPERILVVSGANQGGKTTFARTLGQLHYWAGLGCPVAAHRARLFLPDRIFTHFERQEDVQTLRSKLEDDLVRIRAILEQATSRSLLIMNESFSSATWQDALFLGRQIMERVTDLDLVCVFVTFLEELSSLNAKTVSMVSTVQPDNPSLRLFKIVRMPADGLAYAAAIAAKYELSYEDVKRRIAS